VYIRMLLHVDVQSLGQTSCKLLQKHLRMGLQARARLRELHADILAGLLAVAKANADELVGMGWDREDRKVRLLPSPQPPQCP